jgi:hypothetical protein
MKCDVPVTAIWLVMMYTHSVGRKKDDGNGKEYTITKVAYHWAVTVIQGHQTQNKE